MRSGKPRSWTGRLGFAGVAAGALLFFVAGAAANPSNTNLPTVSGSTGSPFVSGETLTANTQASDWSYSGSVSFAYKWQNCAAYAPTIAAAAPAGYWRLGEAAHASSAADSSGHGLSGTYGGSVSLGQGGALAGDPDTAASFDGSTAFIEVPDSSRLDPASAFTLEAWVKTTASAASVIIAKPFTAGTEQSYSLGINATGHAVGTVVTSAGTYSVTSTAAVNDGNWHLLDAIFNAASSDLSIYVDGANPSTSATSGALQYSSAALEIGRFDEIAGQYFSGLLDEAAVYGSALSSAQLASRVTIATDPVNSSSCSPISGATSSTYVLANTDVGDKVSVAVTATDNNGPTTVFSDSNTILQGTAPPPNAPQNTAAPTIAGTPAVASTLTAGPGTWSGDQPISYAYQWQRCTSSCTNIPGATDTTYMVQAEDQGDSIAVAVTATNAAGNATATSAQTAAVPTGSGSSPPSNTSPPSITGDYNQGGSLTAYPGAWTGSPTTYQYQWQDCASYSATVLADQPTSYWRLDDPANPDGAAASAVDATANHNTGTYGGSPTLGVAGGLSGDPDTAAAFNGTNQYVTLTGSYPTGRSAATLEAWYKPSSLPTGAHFLLGYGDTSNANYQFFIGVSGNKAEIRYGTLSLVGATTLVVGTWYHIVGVDTATALQLYVNAATGAPDGTVANPGSAFSKANGQGQIGRFYPPSDGGTYAAGSIDDAAIYSAALTGAQIEAHYLSGTMAIGTSCTDIAGATSQLYQSKASDATNRIRVQVTATNATGLATASSTATMVGNGTPTSTVPPVIVGDPEQGQTLSVGAGLWEGSGSPTTYQWQHCGYQAAVLEDQPLSYFRLDEPAGTTATDSGSLAASGSYGTYVGFPTLAQPGALSGDPDTGIVLNGSGEKVNLTGMYPTGRSPVSIEAWVKLPATVIAGPVAGYGSTTSGDKHSFLLYVNSTSPATADIWIDGVTYAGTTALTPGEWYQLVAVDDGTNLKLYVNGKLDSTFTPISGYSKLNGSASIGGLPTSSTASLTAGVDDVSIYGTALSADQVATHYQAAIQEQAGFGCQDIPGASGTFDLTGVSHYTVTGADNGYKLRVKIVQGTTETDSNTVTVSTSAPANAQPPAISGATAPGSTLTADPGSWAGTQPSSYDYQWNTCTYQDTVLADGATGYWRFGDNPGQQVAADSTGNHNDGSLDALGVNTTQGILGATGALGGDGDTAALLSPGQEIVVNDATDLDSSTGYSVELWLKPSSAIPPTSNALIATAFTNTGSGRFELYETTTGTVNWLIQASGGNAVASSTTKLLDPTHWYYIVATVGQGTSHIYIDGTQDGSATYTGTLSTTSTPIHFGANFNVPQGVSATLDEAAYYPSALTQSQITAHLDARSCSPINGETNATHTVSSGDAGKHLSVTVTASNVAGQATTSSLTFQVGGSDLPTNVTRPAVSGDWSIGGSGVQTDDGTWSSSSPLTYSYQWQRCTYAQTILADHPDAYWPLDETGGPTVKDLSGNEVDGTAAAVNFGVPGGLADGAGSAVSISGTGSGITVPATTVLNNGNTISIEAWVRLPSTTATQYIVDKGFYQTYTYDGGGNITGTVDHGDFQVLVDRFGEIRLDRSDSADTMLAESSVTWPTDGNFHYLVVTRAVGTYHIYLDGVDVTGSHPGGPSFENTTEPLEIGQVGLHTGPDGSVGGGGNYFTGAIDDLAIYPTALTAPQVSAHYTAGQSPCTDISGQTSASYTIASDDVGTQVRAEVTATNGNGSATASSLGTYIAATPATGQLQPLDGANVQTVTPQLVKVGLEPSDDYEFELSNNRDFATAPGQWVRDSAWLSAQNYYVVPTTWGLKNGNSYWWHVRTRSNNVVASWEGPNELNVEFAPSGVPSYWAMWKSGPLAVNLANGNLVYSPPTPSYPTATGTMALSLIYNSLDTVSNGWGWGWLAMGGDQFATPPTLVDYGALGGENIVVATWKDGSVGVYNRVGTSSIYTSPAGDDSTLRTDGGSPAGSYTLTDASGDIFVYGPANSTTGQAVLQSSEIIDAQAGKAKLTYTLDSYSRITSITDDAGRKLTLTWPVSGCTGNGCFLAVAGPDGTTWKYITGSSGLLTSISDGTRTLESLTYDSSHRLIKIQNADDLDPTHASPGYNSNHSIQITYDSAGRVSQLSEGPITGQVPTTSTTSFSYHPVTYTSPCAPPQLCSLSTDPTQADHHIPSDGYPWDRNYNPPGSPLPAGSTRAAAGYTVVTPPNLQPPNSGGITTYYDGLNHPMETIDALGRITQEDYNAKNQLLWSEDADGNPTDYTYDAVTDQQLSVTGPPPSTGAARPVTYNRYDEMSVGTATDPGQPLEGLQGAYYSNPNLSGRPTATRTDGTVNFSWGAGGPATLPGVTSNFSVRWSGLLDVPQTGSYTLMTNATSGTRLTIDGMQAISNWKDQPLTLVTSQPIALTKGPHQISLDYYVKTSTADVQLEWSCPGCGTPIATEVIPADNLLPNWGNQTSTVSPGGRVSFSHFAAPWAGHPDYTLALLDTSDPVSPADDPTTSFTYDSYGRVTKKVMPDGNAGRTIGPNGDLSGTADSRYATTYTYYGPGDTVSPPASCPTGMGGPYNQAEQLKSTNTYGLAAVTLVYDSAGNAIASTNGLGSTCSHYDAENRLQWSQAPGDAQQTTDTYDPAGNVTSVSSAAGTITTNYDEAGRAIKTTDASGAVAMTTYDADGNAITRLATPTAGGGSYTTSYTYDHADKLTTETDPTGLVYSFYYDDLGNLRATQYPNDTFSWTDTNPDGWVTDVFNRHGTLSGSEASAPADSTPIVDYTYSYNQDGQKAKETRTGGGLATRVTNYAYDNLGRLQQVTLPSGTMRVYDFDLDSNRTSIVENGTTVATYTYNPATNPGVDELTSITTGGATTNYKYTTDGQVKNRGNDTLTWDGWARTTGGIYSGTAVAYTYDPSGSLLTRSAAGVVIRYLLGDSFEADGSGTINTSYVDGPSGDPAQYQGPPVTGSTITYLYYSGHGDLAAEANASGTRIASHTYDPFGTPLDTPPANKTVHRFTGRWNKQYDTTSGLVLMGARPYDPALGRFLEVDPVPGGSLNNYDYADQDPVNRYDLSGRSTWCTDPGSPCEIVDDGSLSVCWLYSGRGQLACYTPVAISAEERKNGVTYKFDVTSSPAGGDHPSPESGELVVGYKNGTEDTSTWHLGHASGLLGFLCTASDGPTPFSKKQLLNPALEAQVVSDFASVLACPDAAR